MIARDQNHSDKMRRDSFAALRNGGTCFASRVRGRSEKRMDRMIIRGGSRIEGSVQVCGAKNAALPQIAAALLSAERLELGNVPEVSDIDTMLLLMQELGVAANRAPGHPPGCCGGGARHDPATHHL